jgi:hypothetical protein
MTAFPSFLSPTLWHGTDRLRNYIGKDWFLDIAFRQEPSPLAKRIAEVLGEKEGKDTGK